MEPEPMPDLQTGNGHRIEHSFRLRIIVSESHFQTHRIFQDFMADFYIYVVLLLLVLLYQMNLGMPYYVLFIYHIIYDSVQLITNLKAYRTQSQFILINYSSQPQDGPQGAHRGEHHLPGLQGCPHRLDPVLAPVLHVAHPLLFPASPLASENILPALPRRQRPQLPHPIFQHPRQTLPLHGHQHHDAQVRRHPELELGRQLLVVLGLPQHEHWPPHHLPPPPRLQAHFLSTRRLVDIQKSWYHISSTPNFNSQILPLGHHPGKWSYFHFLLLVALNSRYTQWQVASQIQVSDPHFSHCRLYYHFRDPELPLETKLD